MKNTHRRARGDAACSPHQPSPAFDTALEGLVEETIDAITRGEDRPDAVFGDFAAVVSLARSVAFHEGAMLETALERLVALLPHLDRVPARAMPVVPAALEALKRNAWGDLQGIRLESRVHAPSTYTPDLLIVNRTTRQLLILDLKRSLASYSEHRLNRLRQRMMAVAMIGVDWLYQQGVNLAIDDVVIAIIDCANEARQPSKGVFSLDEIDGLVGAAGIVAAINRLRAAFATSVQAELASACGMALRGSKVRTTGFGTLHTSPTPEHADPDDTLSGRSSAAILPHDPGWFGPMRPSRGGPSRALRPDDAADAAMAAIGGGVTIGFARPIPGF